MTAASRNGHQARHELVRQANRRAVLHCVLESAPVSRADIAGLTGLSKPTVLAVVAELEDEGLVRVQGTATGGIGRAALLYEANTRAGFVVGVDLGGTKVRAALADLAGEVLAEEVEPTDPDGGRAVVAQLAALCRRLAAGARVPWRSVRVVGLGSPGIVANDGTIALADNISGLDGLDLAGLLARRLRTEVVIENDVNLAALAEQWRGVAASVRHFAVLSVGTGVGLGLVLDGTLVRGARGAAGEAAYLPVGRSPADPEARRRGALEVSASASGLAAMVRRHVAGGATTRLRRTSPPEQVFALAEAGDTVAGCVVREEARLLAEAILAVTAVVDPELVVLAGGIGSNPALLAPVRAALHGITPIPVRVETTALGPRSGVVGAVALAGHRARDQLFLEPRRPVHA